LVKKVPDGVEVSGDVRGGDVKVRTHPRKKRNTKKWGRVRAGSRDIAKSRAPKRSKLLVGGCEPDYGQKKGNVKPEEGGVRRGGAGVGTKTRTEPKQRLVPYLARGERVKQGRKPLPRVGSVGRRILVKLPVVKGELGKKNRTSGRNSDSKTKKKKKKRVKRSVATKIPGLRENELRSARESKKKQQLETESPMRPWHNGKRASFV